MTQLMDDSTLYAEEFAALGRQLSASEPSWLGDVRRAAFESFQSLGFPTTNMEAWRATSVARIAETAFQPAPLASPAASDVKPFVLEGLDCHQLVFINGHWAPQHSRCGNLPKGLSVTTFREALARNEKSLREHFARHTDVEGQAFTALNTALMRDGAFIHVAGGAAIEKPIVLLFLSVDSAVAHSSHSRNVFIFEANSESKVIEVHASIGGKGTCFNNSVTEAFVGANARVDHYRIQSESKSAYHVNELRLYQERDSFFRSHSFDFGGALVRNNLYAKLDGKACEAVLNGLYMLDGTQHVDNFMWAEHIQENIPSHELYKGVLNDSATSVFTGRIYVHPEAQKTDAKQTNQNLILTDTAKATAKPQLEIYADDVKCTHGATIGQLDDAALFYLLSRGIDKKMAYSLLIKAFVGDITDRVQIPAVREYVERLVEAKMPSGQS